METSLNRRAKLELFEQIRREYEHGVGTIKGVARKLGVHRRLVREALADAVPKERKKPERERPKLSQAIPFVDAILIADRKAPRKQRHTAHRIYDRLRVEMPSVSVAESTVREYAERTQACAGEEGDARFNARRDVYTAVLQLGQRRAG